jgi:hypothetical protein
MGFLLRYSKYAITVTIGLFFMVGIARAAEFQADMVQRSQGMEMKGKIYVKAKKSRVDMNMMGQQTQTISRLDKQTVWVVHPSQGFYMEMPVNPGSPELLGDDQALKKYASKKKVGSETVNGLKCDKYVITFHDQALGKMTTWISKKLEFPVKVIQQGPYGESTVEYYNIQTGNVQDSLFELPPGLQKMTMPNMGGMAPRP